MVVCHKSYIALLSANHIFIRLSCVSDALAREAYASNTGCVWFIYCLHHVVFLNGVMHQV